MKKQRKNNGITLISLVITIIILLILAGITIGLVIGDNGILVQATRAKEETEKAQVNESLDLANMEALINEYTGNIDIPQVKDEKPGELEQENENTFIINSIEDLVFFSYDVTNGNTYEGKTVKLGVNLDFKSDKSYVNPNSQEYEKYGYTGQIKQALISEIGFKPIGELSPTGTNYFQGTFDGNDKVICSLYININKDENIRAGLFATSYGEIKNLGLMNVNIKVKVLSTTVGGIVGRCYNNLYNCYVTGNIDTTGNLYIPIGGICGVLDGKANIENCYNLANINCLNIQEEEGIANIGCGGIVGQIEGEEININRCFNNGNIIADGKISSITVGGIVGSPTCKKVTISNSYNSAKIQGSSQAIQYTNIGGIIGILSSNMNLKNCYNAGEIITDTNQLNVGGIVGAEHTNTSISNVYNSGKITINCKGTLYAGGILGNLADGNNRMDNAYNVGLLEIRSAKDVDNVGSITGILKGIINNCYYLKGTYDIGIGGSGISTEVIQLDSIDKFPSVLEVVNGEGAFKEDIGNINGGYTILEWQ